MVNVSTFETLRLEVLDTLRDSTLDASDHAQVEEVVRARVEAYQERASRGLQPRLASPSQTVERLMLSLIAAGPLTRFFDDPSLAGEIGVRDGTITATTTAGRQEVVGEATSKAEMEAIITRLMSDAGVDVNAEHPIAVHQVWGGEVRASVSIPPVADGLDATFRIYRSSRTTFDQLVEWDSLSEPAAQFMTAVQLLPSTGQLFSCCSASSASSGSPPARMSRTTRRAVCSWASAACCPWAAPLARRSPAFRRWRSDRS